MANEVRNKSHRFYAKQNHVKLTKSMKTKGLILDAGIQLIGGGGPSSYVGQVATRCNVAKTIDTSDRKLMAQRYHFAKTDFENPRLIYAGFYCPVPGAEVANGANCTVTASLEATTGGRVQVTFGGSPTGVIPAGGLLISDPVPISIVNGEKFFERAYVESPVSLGLIGDLSARVGGNANDRANGDRLEFGGATTDKTMSGTVTDGNTTFSWGSVAIVADTTTPSFFLLGDSRTEQAADLFDGTGGELGEVSRSVAAQGFPYINAGTSQALASGWITNHTNRLILAGYCSHIIVNLGYNDIASGANAATTLARLQDVYDDFGDKPIFGTTISPRSSGTFTTVGGQTALSSTDINSLNNSLRALPSPLARVFDISDVVSSARDSGVWKANYTADGVHVRQLGCLAIRDSGVIDLSGL